MIHGTTNVKKNVRLFLTAPRISTLLTPSPMKKPMWSWVQEDDDSRSDPGFVLI
jgi:hypothetical protein